MPFPLTLIEMTELELAEGSWSALGAREATA